MSTRINQYILYGIRLDYKDFNKRLEAIHGEHAGDIEEAYHENGYAKEITGEEGFSMIVDGMNGEYAFFGVVVQKPRVDEHLESASIGNFPSKEKKRLLKRATQLLGEALPKAGWHIITHWH